MSQPRSLSADAVVVGSGVIGSAVALELARAGRSVLVLDKAAGPGHGSTSASSAVIRFLYSTFESTATAWEAKFCWEGWADHLGLPAHQPLADPPTLSAFHRTGMLNLDAPVVSVERSCDLLRAVGVPFEHLDPDALAARFPQLDVGAYWPAKPVTDEAFFDDTDARLGAIYTPDAGFMDDPRLAADNLAYAARLHGARTAYRAEVVACDRVGATWHLALADGRTVESPVVVNAAGPWSGAFNTLAGVGGEFTIGVRALRQEVHQVSRPPAWDGHADPMPAIFDLDVGTYLRPGLGGALLVGSGEPDCDPLVWVDGDGAVDRVDHHVTLDCFETQVMRAARRLPDLVVPNRPSGVVGVYDVADDWTPIYDRTDAPGFYVAMGTSGNQFKNAPLAGRYLAAIVEAVESGHDHDETPVTYVGEHTGLTIDLAAFSRKRPVDTTGSRTVMG